MGRYEIDFNFILKILQLHDELSVGPIGLNHGLKSDFINYQKLKRKANLDFVAIIAALENMPSIIQWPTKQLRRVRVGNLNTQVYSKSPEHLGSRWKCWH